MWIAFIIASGVCLLLSVCRLLFKLYIRMEGNLVSANVISYSEKIGFGKGNAHHSYYAVLSYQFGGVDYQTRKAVQIPEKSSDGKCIEIYCLKINPKRIVIKGYNIWGRSKYHYLILLAIMFFLIGLLNNPHLFPTL